MRDRSSLLLQAFVIDCIFCRTDFHRVAAGLRRCHRPIVLPRFPIDIQDQQELPSHEPDCDHEQAMNPSL